MNLDDILMVIALIFILIAIFFLFRKPKYMSKIDAIFICIFAFIFYTFLGSGYALGWSVFGTILGIVTMEFFISLIYFIIRKPIIGLKWQAIVICLIGLLIYGGLFGTIDEPTYSVPAEPNNIINKTIGSAIGTVKPVSASQEEKYINSKDTNNGLTTNQANSAPTETNNQNSGDKVYWLTTKTSKSYHKDPKCSYISGKKVKSGSVQEAINDRHADPCDKCVK